MREAYEPAYRGVPPRRNARRFPAPRCVPAGIWRFERGRLEAAGRLEQNRDPPSRRRQAHRGGGRRRSEPVSGASFGPLGRANYPGNPLGAWRAGPRRCPLRVAERGQKDAGDAGFDSCRTPMAGACSPSLFVAVVRNPVGFRLRPASMLPRKPAGAGIPSIGGEAPSGHNAVHSSRA
jgi:hypothetical protein